MISEASMLLAGSQVFHSPDQPAQTYITYTFCKYFTRSSKPSIGLQAQGQSMLHASGELGMAYHKVELSPDCPAHALLVSHVRGALI